MFNLPQIPSELSQAWSIAENYFIDSVQYVANSDLVTKGASVFATALIVLPVATKSFELFGSIFSYIPLIGGRFETGGYKDTITPLSAILVTALANKVLCDNIRMPRPNISACVFTILSMTYWAK